MKKGCLSLLLITLFMSIFSASVLAHVTNEKTLYDDIQYSKAIEQIVYLSGLNVIPYESGAALYKPTSLLSKRDLAFWAASFAGIGNANAKREDLEQAAVKKGMMSNLDGNATYADVNQAYFNGKAPVPNPDKTLTREDFALFMGQFFNQKVDGKTLYDMAHFEQGPTGVIEKVTSNQIRDAKSGQIENQFMFTIKGKDYQVADHPKVMYGPTDLTGWNGKKIADSRLTKAEGKDVLEIIKLEKGQFPISQDNADSAGHQKGTPPIVPILGGVILLIVILWLYRRGRT
ncbi:MAG: hypothetical protein K0R75_3963, partial [Paenibacillaceae bacterium]|nr:hypothetical protein [Paenibacillaceae bacterium]